MSDPRPRVGARRSNASRSRASSSRRWPHSDSRASMPRVVNRRPRGRCLGIALLGFGAGLILWAHALMPQGPFAEERHLLATTPEEREAFEDALERDGTLTRRRLLLGGMTGALVALGVAFLFPIRSLGPSPGRTLEQTPWRKGLRGDHRRRPARARVRGTTRRSRDDLPGGPSRFRRRPGRAHARRPRRAGPPPGP